MDPFADAPLLRLLLRGIKRTIGLSSRRRLPITMSVMRQLKGALADNLQIASQDKLMLWSAFTLAFFGFLRSSEFTSPSPTHFNPLVHLACSDISFTSDGSLVLQLKASKTDPFGWAAPLRLHHLAVRSVHSGQCTITWPTGLQAIPPPLYLLNRAVSYQGQSNRYLALTAPTLRLRYRVLCISQFPHWGCNYSCRGRLAPMAYPNPWSLVQQLLHAIHQDTCLNTPHSPGPASRHP